VLDPELISDNSGTSFGLCYSLNFLVVIDIVYIAAESTLLVKVVLFGNSLNLHFLPFGFNLSELLVLDGFVF